MNDVYTKELKKVLLDTTPVPPGDRSAKEVAQEVADITDALRGHLPNVDRLCLVERRHALRKQLDALTAAK